MLLCTKQAHSSSAPADATWYPFHPSFSTVPRPSSTGTPSRSSNWRTPFYKGLANIQTEANLSRASWQQNNNLPVVADTLKSPVPNHNKLYPPIFLSILGAKWPERLKFQWLEIWIAQLLTGNLFPPRITPKIHQKKLPRRRSAAHLLNQKVAFSKDSTMSVIYKQNN